MVNKKIVLVTGGASGIGLGTVEYLLEQGNYEVISFSRGDKNIALAKEKLGENANKGNNVLVIKNMLVKLTLIELFHSSNVCSSNPPNLIIPAEFTNPSNLPYFLSISS